ncbi:unnamed protein product [Microthlaspi erraticum]|uniref:Uncharacterized protein n=1 Tax=Microthlaspi erraticum TaxID=1685480 RepID=A0A6D2HF37_9BRAS|nr:unnamed protein product [Microthlaspi erraticum]
MEVFKRVPESPHFSKLSEIRQDFREGYALGVMATFSGLLEKFKDLEADVPISQLDSLKDSFTELEKHGFDVTRPLSRIEKLLVLKDRQLNVLKKQKDLDKKIIVEKRKSEQECAKMERTIIIVGFELLIPSPPCIF